MNAITITEPKTNPTTGRPTKFTPSTVKRVLNCVRRGMPMRLASEAAAISPATLSNYRTKHPRFAEALRHAIARGVDSRLRVVERALKSQDESIRLRAATWMLEHSPETAPYFSRSRVELSGPDGAPLAVGNVIVYLPAKGGGSGAIEVGGDGRKEIENTDKTKGQS
jgi:hypothetical protein